MKYRISVGQVSELPLFADDIMTLMTPTRALAAFVLLAASMPAARAADCDRECLRGFITQYLNAMVVHNPTTLPLADRVKFTEDTVEKRLGDGLWKTASGLRK
jgi:hypothetical protein